MAASANWQCADCDNVNGPGDRACDGCGNARPAPAPRPGTTRGQAPADGGGAPAPRSPAKRPAPARPSKDWQCSKCDTNNVTSDLSCIGCGTGWKAATKKSAPRKTPGPGGAKPTGGKPTSSGPSAPKRPAPKRSAPSAPRTPRASAPPPTGPTRPHPRPEGAFYPPPSATGYTPTAPRPSAPHPPPAPAPAPPAYVAPRTSYAPRPKRSNGCVGCLSAIGLVFVLGIFADGCKSLFDHGSASAKPSSSASGSPCPSRIAGALPSGDGARLVEAFVTQNKQITLCRTTAGNLYYFGEFSDHREPGIAMPAKKTDSGYEATNAPYRYVIHDGVVTIYESGSRIGQEKVTAEPSPS
ncbi:zinc finger protein [Streptomyces sp. NPDC048416]|uniref:zinc finger protein n=1 Tax=Streptomyces sp. NPDC048416 TaxID=3365546 RepID=UPI003710AE97